MGLSRITTLVLIIVALTALFTESLAKGKKRGGFNKLKIKQHRLFCSYSFLTGAIYYNPKVQFCCGEKVYKKSKRSKSSVPDSCCGGVVYKWKAEMECCADQLLNKATTTKACCRKHFFITPKVYDTRQKICCNGDLYSKGKNKACCGSNIFNTKTQICCSGKIHPKDTTHPCCGPVAALSASIQGLLC